MVSVVQVEPQLMPAGELVTVPETTAVPSLVIVSWWEAVGTWKAALTDLAASIVTLQAPVPVQSPLQPLKTVLVVWMLKVRATDWPEVKLAVHVAPHSMPAGAL